MKKIILTFTILFLANFSIAGNLQLTIDSIIVDNQVHKPLQTTMNIQLPSRDSSFYIEYANGKLPVKIKYYQVTTASSSKAEYLLIFGKGIRAIDFWIDEMQAEGKIHAYASPNNGFKKLGIYGFYS